jgi:hypothetical protein
MKRAELEVLLPYLTPAERVEFERLVQADLDERIWAPLPGPQTMASESQADIIGFGGAAGGGKSDLAIGKSLTQHHEVLIMRREGTQLQGILHRMTTLLGNRDGYNGQDKIWRDAGPRKTLVEFGSCPNLGDEQRQQGRPHDFLVFDEAANFLEEQVRFLLGWNRSTRDGVHSQALLTFNPPTTTEGRWIIGFFAPWLDKNHPLYPTPPGVIRYCVMLPAENGTSRDIWVDRADPCVVIGGELVYDFDPEAYAIEDIIVPQSRTFIPSRISDNPFLSGSGYLRQLQAMPEPLRSQMLYGDFQAGMQDDPWQVVPTAWVEAAQKRWTDRAPKGEMLGQGVDVARGGKDQTVIANRHKNPDGSKGDWIDRLKVYPGTETPDGPMVAGLVIASRRDEAPVHIDVIGVGASPYDVLNAMRLQVLGVNVSEKSTKTDRSGKLTFMNQRSQLWWDMREALDPANDTGLALPPDKDLAIELCTPRWRLRGMTIQVESREEIWEKLHRSVDRASAVLLALIDTPKRAALSGVHNPGGKREHDPYAALNP